MKKRFAVAAVLLIGLAPALPASASELAELVRNYQDAHARLQKRLAEALGKHAAAYEKALSREKQARTAAGDLDGLLAIAREQERFGRDRDMPTKALVALPPTVRESAGEYQASVLLAEIDSQQGFLRLIEEDYLLLLMKLLENVTRSGKLEDAREIQAAVKAAREKSSRIANRFHELGTQWYEALLFGITARHAVALQGLYESYLATLDTEIAQRSKRGDVEQVLPIMREKKRFEVERSVPADLSPELPEAVRRAGSAYHSAVRKANVIRDRAFLKTMNEAYLPREADIARELIRLGRTDEALHARSRIRDVTDAVAWREKRIPPAPLPRQPVPSVLSEGLLLSFRFDDDGLGRAMDSSRWQRHARLSGVRWTPFGRVGGAAELEGTAFAVAGPWNGPLSGSGDFTLATWLRTEAAEEQTILQQRDAASANGEYELLLQPDGIPAYYDYSRSRFGLRARADRAVNDNRWHHVVFVRSADEGILYVDGELSGKTEGRRTPLSPRRRFCVGCDYADQAAFFQGLLDEVRIYGRALSAREVRMLYEAEGGRQ